MVAGGIVAVAGYLVLAAFLIGFGFLLRDVLLPGSIARWDRGNIRFLVDGRPEWNSWSDLGTLLADAGPVIAMSAVIIGLSLVKRWYRVAGLVFVGVCLEGLLYLTGSRIVHRMRPAVPRFEHLPADTSYPSGHTAAAVVLYFVVAVVVANATTNRFLRTIAWVPFVVFPALVAVSRMYRGMHFATDTVVGYLIGIGCIAVALLTVRVAGVVADRRAAR